MYNGEMNRTAQLTILILYINMKLKQRRDYFSNTFAEKFSHILICFIYVLQYIPLDCAL